MMFGSLFYNFWFSLIGFTIYFFATFQSPYTATRVIIGSFVVAIIVFFATFLLRMIVAYILYTPSEEVLVDVDENVQQEQQMSGDSKLNEQAISPAVEFQDETAEEIAEVVRTMMKSD